MVRIARRFAKRIGIVGAGPCGLALGLFLRKAGVEDVTVFERKSRAEALNCHPAAHYLNSRSLEVFSEVPGLKEAIRVQAEDLQAYRRYLYCRQVGGLTYQATDQLPPAVLAELAARSDESPCHIPQTRLVQLLFEAFERQAPGRLLLGASVKAFRQSASEVAATQQIVAQVASERGLEQHRFDHLILADGFRSSLRPLTAIRLVGEESSVR